jgi:DNA-binding MurR/RpiR family transcriptional regulator
MNKMMEDVEQLAKSDQLSFLAEQIHKSANVVILTAENSISSVKLFQDGMVPVGKVIRLMTTSTANDALLSSLSKEDLVITNSATGNYALAINDFIQKIKAPRFLITMNHSAMLKATYDKIFYLSHDAYASDTITHGLQNVYTRYGTNYFFDLLYHAYVMKYQFTSTLQPPER